MICKHPSLFGNTKNQIIETRTDAILHQTCQPRDEEEDEEVRCCKAGRQLGKQTKGSI